MAICNEFVKKDHLSNNLIKTIEDTVSKKSYCPISRFDPSNITECQKRLCYRINKIKPDRIFLPTFDSIYIKNFKNKWIEYLKRCSGVRVSCTNITGSDFKHNITSVIDAVIEVDEIISVIKMIPLFNDSFNNILDNGPFKKDVIEIMIQMWLLEIGDGIVLYENVSTRNVFTFHIKPYKSIINSVREKCNKINKIRNVEEIERGYKNKDNKECKSCEFFICCWENKNEKEI